MRILKTEVYRFSELDEQIQEQVVERMAQIYLATDYWNRPIIDGAIKELNKAGIVVVRDTFFFDLNLKHYIRFGGKVRSLKTLIQFFGLKEEYLQIADIDDPITFFVYKKEHIDEHAVVDFSPSRHNDDRLDQLFQDLEKKMTIFCKFLWKTFFCSYELGPKFTKEVILPELDAWYYSNGMLVDLIDEEPAQYDRGRSYIMQSILEKHFQESTTGVEGCTISAPRSCRKPE